MNSIAILMPRRCHALMERFRSFENRGTARPRGRGAALILAACFTAACGPPPRDTPFLGTGPVLIFDIDTLRADHLGCYGYDRETSPRIDALANEGYRFEWAFSQAPKTSLSQGSIFTGLYPSTHGLIEDGEHLSESLTTLAEAFSASGYRTAAFVDGGYMQAKYGFDQGFETYEVHHRTGLETLGPRVIEWLSEHEQETFLLLVHTYDVHHPFEAPEPYHSMFLADIERTLDAVRAQAVFDGVEGSREIPLSPYDLAHSQALYDGGIRFADDWIGRILDVVWRLGLDRRATIVLLSDHGEAFQEHGLRGHSRLYAPVTRIPLVIRPPGGREGKVLPDVVQSIDVMPTLLDGAGIDLPPGLQGRSLIPLLRGESLRPRPAFAEAPWFHQSAVAFGEHQLVLSEDQGRELFEFRRDPLELHDISAQRPQDVDELGAIGKRWRKAVERRGRPDIVPSPLDEKTLDDLRALGYIQ